MNDNFIGIDLEKFKEVKTQSDFEELNDLTVGFHDSLIKEMHIINSAYIDEHQSMYCNSAYNIRLLIQIQWKNTPALEIILGNVLETHLFDLTGITHGHGAISFDKLNESPFIVFDLDNNKFICKRFLYRLASELCGKESRFGEEIILESTDLIEWIDNEWVICKKCCEAWIPGARKVLKCPKCGF